MGLTVEQIIDLAVCHSNYKLDSNARGTEYEAFSHPNIIGFARALIERVMAPEEDQAQMATDGKPYARAAAMWMVKGKGPTSYVHGSEAYALQEAKRLAANHPGEQFTVMVSTKSFVASIEEIDRSYVDDGLPF